MHVVIFGLSISSSWGNGHATLWRGLVRALARRGHTIRFYERDVPYYASTRDGWTAPAGLSLCLYNSLREIAGCTRRDLNQADVALFTSFCPDGADAARMILDSRASVKAFYDLDTPVTLQGLQTGMRPAYLPPFDLSGFDLVLSFTGGKALKELRTRLGARNVVPLYGFVDPEAHLPAAAIDRFRGSLSYLGTYAADRQRKLEELFVEPARRMTAAQFQLAGAQFPQDFPWQPNIHFISHLEPVQHPAFFCSSRATLNVTRGVMAELGYCPSGRLFEAAACGAPLLSDTWDGLDSFFTPGREILYVQSASDVTDALSLSDTELRAIAEAGRARVLADHTAAHRARQLESACDEIARGTTATALAS
ncbi:MAG: glycosyltransferase [Acidobacteriota bacterium]